MLISFYSFLRILFCSSDFYQYVFQFTYSFSASCILLLLPSSVFFISVIVLFMSEVLGHLCYYYSEFFTSLSLLECFLAPLSGPYFSALSCCLFSVFVVSDLQALALWLLLLLVSVSWLVRLVQGLVQSSWWRDWCLPIDG